MFKYAVLILSTMLLSVVQAEERPGNLAEGVNPGALEVLLMGGEKPAEKLEMPLQHTDVQIEISGFVASATITQQYQNPFEKPIEAVYTFPLPDDAAVDDMSMTIGERVIKGLIKRREEAREIYEKARNQGQRASLLEQERPNIFTQSVANIMPGENITITIHYVNPLKYAEGSYELVFPMVVGPRYIPGGGTLGKTGTGWSPDVTPVPDASKITPPILKPDQRAGHDIALAVKLNAGLSIKGLHSISHVIDTTNISDQQKVAKLHPADTIPNKDFILRYEVAGNAPEMAVIPHRDERGGFFSLMIQPQREVTNDQVVPRELIFIVDTSGSMRGFPMDKSKEAMWKLIKGMRSTDTFNVVRFAGDTGTLWSEAQSFSAERAQEAIRYVEGFRGSGGTEMRLGIMEALAKPATEGRLRIAFLMTDGYVGNEADIFQAIEKERRGARIFTLGVGSSVNRYLLDRSATIGRGEAFYVRQDEDSSAVIDKFFKRVDRPALAYIEVDWGNLNVEQLYPEKIPDLWAGQPIQLTGRYQSGGTSDIVVRGQLGQKAYQQKLNVNLPHQEPANSAIATIWARQKVRALMDDMVAKGKTSELIEAVTQVGLTFRLMTQWTSFVAVEEKVVNVDGKPQTVVQPVEMPEGVSYEGIFGESSAQDEMAGKGLQFNGAPMLSQPSLRRNFTTRGGSVNNSVMPAAPTLVEEADSAIVSGEPTRRVGRESRQEEMKDKEDRAKILPEIEKKEKVSVNIKAEPITFELGQSGLTDEAKKALDALAIQICQNMASLKQIVVTGHADNSAGDNYKQKLSLERATAVANYLVSHCQALTYDRIIMKGEADRTPLVSNDTEAGRAQNRRVEIRVMTY